MQLPGYFDRVNAAFTELARTYGIQVPTAAANKISISGKLYADLSQVTSGNVTVLFLADVPDQVRLLTVYGKLKMGFRNGDNAPMAFVELVERSHSEEAVTDSEA